MTVVYVLFVLFMGDGIEREWKSFSRFEECWEVATTIVKNRNDVVARCVAKEVPAQQ